MSETLEVVSHEQDGRILSGVGASVEELADTMDRHTPEEQQIAPVSGADPAPAPAAKATGTTQAEVDAAVAALEKPVTRGQKRFAELTREREDARREAAALRLENEQLKASQARPAVAASAPAPATPPVAAAPSPAKPETRAKPTEDEIGTKYQSYGDFVEDLADWKAEQRLASLDLDARVRTSIEADRASRSFQDTVAKTLAAGREAYPDFDAVRAASDVKFPQPVLDVILAMDEAKHVIYQLAKDRSLAERVANADPYQVGLILGSLRTAQAGAPPASPARSTVTPPPAPYQPVQGGSKTTVPPSADLAKAGFDFDKSGYRERRAAERSSRR